MNPYLADAIAAEKRRVLIAAADRQRLVALVNCCRPSRLARAVCRIREAWAAVTAGRHTACCTAA